MPARSGDDEVATGAGLAPPEHASWSTNPIADWLVNHGGKETDLGHFLQEFCQRLAAQGVPLFRVYMGVRPMHPEVAASNVIWRRGEAGHVQADHGYGMQLSEAYLNSPVRLILEGAGAFRRRLEGPDVVRDCSILDELAGLGVTDYVIMPLLFSTGEASFISWTTDRPGGFATDALSLLYDLLPLLALRVELETSYQTRRTLLTTYLGREPARRVLAGRVRRGQIESIRAAIWISDLRGFTRLSDRLAPRAVIALLDDYFDVLAQAVEGNGGEILKFLGDGMLAIFEQGTDAGTQCTSALAAAKDALAGLADSNAERTGEGQPAIRFGIGLHVGEVQFGNIGSRQRLDFTVIGPAVNEAARVEALCKELGKPLLVSAAFAAAAGHRGLRSLGAHALRGIEEQQEIYALEKS